MNSIGKSEVLLIPGDLSADGVADALFLLIPEAKIPFRKFTDGKYGESFSWSCVDFEIYQFTVEVFTLPILIPELQEHGYVGSDLLGRCMEYSELLLSSRYALVADVAWFEILEPLLNDAELVRRFHFHSRDKSRSEVERLAKINQIGLDPL